ncbi:hypothetical protein D3C78_1896450 [compost metagenome]
MGTVPATMPVLLDNTFTPALVPTIVLYKLLNGTAGTAGVVGVAGTAGVSVALTEDVKTTPPY